jgi:hypothetical protein
MIAEEIRTHIRAQPFRPFTMRLANGRQIPVAHRDFVLLSPTGRLVDVYQPDDSHNIIDVFLVLNIDFPAPVETPPNPSTNGS